MTDHGTHADAAPLDTAQLRSWARWCPGQTNLMCLNHLLHRAADEIDRLRTEAVEYRKAERRLAGVEALCLDGHTPPDGDDEHVNCWPCEALAAARGEAPHA